MELCAQREQKQKYLRNNISETLYQEFGEFCQTETGGIDIDSWTFVFLEQLVGKFNDKQKRKEQQISLIRNSKDTFHNYQTSSPQQILEIAQQAKQSEIKALEERKNIKKTNPTSQQSQKKKSQNNANDLFDNVFKTVCIDQNMFATTKQSQIWQAPNMKTPIKLQSKIADDDIFNTMMNYQTTTKNTKIQNKKPQIEQSKAINSILSFQNEIKHSQQQQTQPNFSKKKNQKKQTIKKNDNQVSKVSNQNDKKQEIKYEKIPHEGVKIIKQEFQDVVPCFKSAIREALNKSKLQVTIQNHEIFKRSFFNDYVMYYFKVKPANIQIQRNYQDFIKLRKAFSQVYPGIQLPYLQKTSWWSETNPQSIKSQSAILQFFLNDICSNKQLKNSRIFEDFLTLRQHKKMKRKFEEYERMAKVKSIEQLCLLSGKVNIKIKQEQRIFQEKFLAYLSKMERNFDRHEKLSEVLQNQYQAVSNTLTSLGELMDQIQKDTYDFNCRVTCHEIRYMEKTYKTLNEMYKESNQTIKYEIEALSNKILPHIKYEKVNMGTLRQIHTQSAIFTRSFLKRSDSEFTPISDPPYLDQKYKQVKNRITEQSKNLLVLKYQTGFLNYQSCKESQRAMQLLSRKVRDKWNSIGQGWLQQNNKRRQYWETNIKNSISNKA